MPWLLGHYSATDRFIITTLFLPKKCLLYDKEELANYGGKNTALFVDLLTCEAIRATRFTLPVRPGPSSNQYIDRFPQHPYWPVMCCSITGDGVRRCLGLWRPRGWVRRRHPGVWDEPRQRCDSDGTGLQGSEGQLVDIPWIRLTRAYSIGPGSSHRRQWHRSRCRRLTGGDEVTVEVKLWAISSEPTTVPSLSLMRLPAALCGKDIAATPVMNSG